MSNLAANRADAPSHPAVLTGGVAVSRLRVYDVPAPDGWAGGSPHMHLACAEAYVVLGGVGSVELLSLLDGYQRLELRAGDAVQFDPGVVHRLVNDGELEILVLMQNAGLPENGDAVFTFPTEILESNELYRQCAAIDSLEDAIARRDRAVAGLEVLKDGFASSLEEGRRLLSSFQQRASGLVRSSAETWLDIVEAGPGAAVVETRERVERILGGEPVDLDRSHATRIVTATERLGMCGRLNPFAIEGTRVSGLSLHGPAH
jgi:mannose-6-phosphate isomerase-like protein (cupin superfamily)